jgi:HEAT repeat protein
MTSSLSKQIKIFVSYSQQDSRSLERLKVHLTPYMEGDEIEWRLWDDTQILAGSYRLEHIQQALQSADAAILLVSADFLASRFIKENELPPLLQAAQQRDVLIMPVIIKPCAFQNDKKLSQFQAVNDPSRPLLRLPSAQREEGWTQVARNISIALRAQQDRRRSSASSPTSTNPALPSQTQQSATSASQPTSTDEQHATLPGAQGDVRSPTTDDRFLTQIQGTDQGLVVGANPTVNTCWNQPAAPTPSVPDPPAILSEELIARYSEKLRNDAEITQLQILDMHHPLQVSDIYVKVRLSSQARPRPEREKEQQQMHDPLTIMQQQERWLERRAHTAIDPAVAIKQHQRCVIVGDPGAGKTTMLKRLALLSINNKLAGLPSLPVYIKLHEFAQSGNNDLLDFAATLWEQAYAIPKTHAASLLAERMEAGDILLLLDALDETVIGANMTQAEESYKLVALAILRLTQRYHRVPIVVTARKEGYRQRGPLPGFTILEVLDFLPEQIEQFITRWFEHYGDERRRGIAAGLITALKNQPRMATLAANPLLLSLIVLVYEGNGQQLPENRSRLYQQCVDTLLHKWDASRFKQRARSFSSDDQKQLLPVIAWHFHSQGLRSFPENQLLAIIANFLLMRGKDARQAIAVLQAIRGDDGLLREQANGTYGFLHLTLQEFFASQHVDDLSSLLVHLGDPWWEEVILLYIGQTHNATPLLEHLLTGAGEGEIPEDIFASKLTLAGRCLAANPVIRKVQLWQEIPDRLFEQLLHTDDALVRHHVAEALAEIGRAHPEREINTRLLALLKGEENRLSVRSSITDALSGYGTRDLAANLLEYFVEKGAGLEKELRERLLNAIALLVDRRLLSRLEELLLEAQSDPLILIGLAEVIAEVGDANTARLLFPLLSDPTRDIYVQHSLAYAVGTLGDAHTIAVLVSLLAAPGIDERMATGVLLSLLDRDYREAAPKLLAILSQHYIRRQLGLDIAFVLGAIGDEAIADQLASLATNPAQDPLIRAICAMAFTMCGCYARQSKVLSMLADTTLDNTLRSAIARGLALVVEQGNVELREGLHTIYAQECNEKVRFYLTIASGLLGDTAVLAQLRGLFGQEKLPGYLLQRVAECLVEQTSASQLMEMLTNSEISLDARVALAGAIGSVGTSSLVPELLMVLENRVVIEEVRVSAAEAIELLGRTREVVERLLRLWQALRLREIEPSALTDAIYQAMWAVSRRVGVIVFQDGFAYKIVERKSFADSNEADA